jgi:2-keto-4-pentenoate hydratase/2-oxohepta-3-ene-1,7-dioic acid hydratase in catechol pathway
MVQKAAGVVDNAAAPCDRRTRPARTLRLPVILLPQLEETTKPMKLCRYDDDRLGLVQGDEVLDVSAALDLLPSVRWPLPQGDLLIANLDKIIPRVRELAPTAPRKPVASIKFKSPVANPTKIVNAPINYTAHIDEAKADPEISVNKNIKNIWDWGLFLKANSALIGFGEEIALRWPDRRNDHEIELAVIIGKTCNKVKKENALDYVAGYAMGLDMTIRGPELPSFRKSVDTYAVCGPWLVTKDEVANPNKLNLAIKVNGEPRQASNTSKLVYDVHKLIEYASSFYTLHPGDIIFTGTPEGVGPVKPGDVLSCEIESVGKADIRVAADYAG